MAHTKDANIINRKIFIENRKMYKLMGGIKTKKKNEYQHKTGDIKVCLEIRLFVEMKYLLAAKGVNKYILTHSYGFYNTHSSMHVLNV